MSLVLGTLLTWMAERKSRVFIAATANDISILPPDLVRKSHLDEIFFVDLLDLATRKQVLAIHLKRRELKPQLYPSSELASPKAPGSGRIPDRAFLHPDRLLTARDQWPAEKVALLSHRLEYVQAEILRTVAIQRPQGLFDDIGWRSAEIGPL